MKNYDLVAAVWGVASAISLHGDFIYSGIAFIVISIVYLYDSTKER